MGWTPSLVAVAVLAGAVIAAAVGVAALRRRPDPLAVPLAVLMLAVTAWSVPHAIGLGVSGVEQVAFWQRVRYLGTLVAPVAYLVVALRYAGYERWLTRRAYVGLSVIPAVTLVVIWTNLAGLFWQTQAVVMRHGVSVFVTEYGPWYWVMLGYIYLLTTAALALFGAATVRSGRIYRKQAGLMFLGGLVPLATNVVFKLSAGAQPAIDFTPTALAFSGLTFAAALFEFDMLEVRPVARDHLVEELDDGVVVIGPEGKIRDYNPTAAAVLEGIGIDQDAEEVFPRDVAPDGGELVVETGDGERMYRTRSSEITDARGRQAGRIVYLHDVTEVVRREQRISVLNRILRHNVRNQLNVAIGNLDRLSEDGATDDEALETARESVRRVVEFAEKARDVERTLGDVDSREVVDATEVAARVVADGRERYPAADIELTAPDVPRRVQVVDEDLLDRAIRELVENAVEHNDRAEPSVTVAVGEVAGAAVEGDGAAADTEVAGAAVEGDGAAADTEVAGAAVEGDGAAADTEVAGAAVEGDGARGVDADRRVQVDEDTDIPGTVAIRVADDGPGIEDAETRVLSAGSETTLRHGSGVGLWLVKWTASLSAGELSFATGAGRGTVVTLSLPAAVADAEAAPEPRG